MSTNISAIQTQSYAKVSSTAAAYLRTRDISIFRGASNASASTTVSLSTAATLAAKADASSRQKLPETSGWLNKTFPEDILAEAKARVAERQAPAGIGDGYLPDSVSNLPLLPENQALLSQFHQEMKAIGHNNSDPEKNARFNQLLNLSLRVQIEGWKAPMSEADAQRELDIQQAIGVIDANNPPKPQNVTSETDTPFDPLAGWQERWKQAGLTMPPVDTNSGKSLWLELADKAGISQDAFMLKARDLASNLKGNALTQALERFISDQYAVTKNALANV